MSKKSEWKALRAAIEEGRFSPTLAPLQPLPQPYNVAHAKARDRIVRRLRKLRADAVLDKNTYEHWNEMHPDEKPVDTAWCDEIIAWCDGKCPLSLRAVAGSPQK